VTVPCKNQTIFVVQGAAMLKNPRPPTKVFAKSSRNNGDGSPMQNLILMGLPNTEVDTLFPKLEFVRMNVHHMIYEAGDAVKSAYFINSGMISVLAVQPDGKSIEVGIIGKEGFVGLPLLVGYSSSPTRVVAQADSTAYRCDAETLRHIMRQCPVLEQQLHRFGQQLAMQTTQVAACNRLHDVEERLARWLLMTQDRIESDHLPLTQEFLGQMLGTRRSSVTVAAGTLQKAGLISYTRGSVAISDRKRLEEAACDCYGIVQQQLKDWEAETK
jgi:CRP-like cAMP-binding protein